MSNNSDIGWLDKSKVDATLRNLKGHKRSRRRSTDQGAAEKGEQPEDFVDLFGVARPSPGQSTARENQSYVATPEPTPDNTTASAEQAALPEPAHSPASSQTATTTDAQTTRRPTTPTAKLGITHDIPEEYTDPSAEARLTPGAHPQAQAATPQTEQRPSSKLTATLETTPVAANEPDEHSAPSPDLSERFKDAFDVLRTSDTTHPAHRTVTAEITPTFSDHQVSDHDALSLAHTAEHTAYDPQDLSLESTGPDNAPRSAAPDDLQLYDSEPFSSHTPQKQTHEHGAGTHFDDDDALSLPAHDLDLSIQTSSSTLGEFPPATDAPQHGADLVFAADEFSDEQSAAQNLATKSLATQHLEDMLLPHVEPSSDTVGATQIGDPQPMEHQSDDDYARPEHAFVPKIHSQILKTVRLRNAPDPKDFQTLYLWLQEVHTWIKNTETSSTRFLVADHAGLSLLDTDIDDDTVARAVAIRRSMAELHEGGEPNASGFTVFRHQEDAYMNLVWAPSDHGIVTVGILSDHVYPDARLATLEEKLVRGIDTLPFI